MDDVASTWDDTVSEHRDRRRQSIIDATMALVAERGMTDVSMADVAKAAGIGRATLYRYFPGVEEIVAERVLGTVRTHHSTVESAIEQQDDPVEAIRVSLRILLEYFASDGHRSVSARVNPDQFSPEVGRAVHDAFAELHAVLTQLVVDAQRAGSLRSDIDAAFTAELLYQMLSAGRTAVVQGRLGHEDALEQIMRQFLHGAGAAEPPRRPSRR
ncbi:MAG: TetR/AcrR family transcriptional regulator [Actinomycetota bacterium]|nr:TetR/AcrR family transcriptional regulator [Actinomycetota bacterium]